MHRVEARIRRRIRRWRWKRALKGRGPEFDAFTPAEAERLTPFPAEHRGDLVHLHWVALFLDWKSFFDSLPDDFPVVWTLHDMQPLSGGCHYAGSCDAYATQCGHCPQLGARGARDLACRSFRVKRDALRGKNLHIVTPSRWLEGEARRSAVLADARSFRTIPYGLDTSVFAPRDRTAVRRVLNLPDEAVVIGFGADSMTTRRKGARELLEALASLYTTQPIVGLAFGTGPLACGDRRLPEIRQVGFLRDPQLQAAIYSAMDFLVMPSLEDNLPQIGIEAMACGVPVVAFETGGIPDYVRPPETGLLAPVGDAQQLASRIAWLAERRFERNRMGKNARALIVREFAAEKQARRYMELYAELMEQQSRRGRRAA
jgi:glycosyltransferase involved in cell wall biosynthesis